MKEKLKILFYYITFTKYFHNKSHYLLYVTSLNYIKNSLLCFSRPITRKKSKQEDDDKKGTIDDNIVAVKEESDPEEFDEQFHQEDSNEELLEDEVDKAESKKHIMRKRRKYATRRSKISADSGGGGPFVDGKNYECLYCDFSSKKPEWISHLKKDHEDKSLVILYYEPEAKHS